MFLTTTNLVYRSNNINSCSNDQQQDQHCSRPAIALRITCACMPATAHQLRTNRLRPTSSREGRSTMRPTASSCIAHAHHHAPMHAHKKHGQVHKAPPVSGCYLAVVGVVTRQAACGAARPTQRPRAQPGVAARHRPNLIFMGVPCSCGSGRTRGSACAAATMRGSSRGW